MISYMQDSNATQRLTNKASLGKWAAYLFTDILWVAVKDRPLQHVPLLGDGWPDRARHNDANISGLANVVLFPSMLYMNTMKWLLWSSQSIDGWSKQDCWKRREWLSYSCAGFVCANVRRASKRFRTCWWWWLSFTWVQNAHKKREKLLMKIDSYCRRFPEIQSDKQGKLNKSQ